MSDPFSTTIAAWVCFLVLGTIAFFVSVKEDGGPRRWTLLMQWLSRYVVISTPTDDDEAVLPRPNAVKENAENGKSAEMTPTELDRIRKDAANEAVARAIGTLTGLGIIPVGQRSQALLAVGLEGRAYSKWKPVVDAAHVQAQIENPAEPRQTPIAGRPVPSGVKFEDL